MGTYSSRKRNRKLEARRTAYRKLHTPWAKLCERFLPLLGRGKGS